MIINVDKLFAMGEGSTPTYFDAVHSGIIQLQNDGEGDYIKKWDHPDIQPSDATINAFDDLGFYKSRKKKELKAQGLTHGIGIWPLHEQIDVNTDNNSSIGTKATLIAFRVGMRSEWQTVKNAIKLAATKAEVDIIIPNWPTV